MLPSRISSLQAGCSEPRIVRQFQIASWSDHDCPNISSVLEYRRVVRAYILNKPGPIVVHCR
jgi:protein tyrosine phosphatase